MSTTGCAQEGRGMLDPNGYRLQIAQGPSSQDGEDCGAQRVEQGLSPPALSRDSPRAFRLPLGCHLQAELVPPCCLVPGSASGAGALQGPQTTALVWGLGVPWSSGFAGPSPLKSTYCPGLGALCVSCRRRSHSRSSAVAPGHLRSPRRKPLWTCSCSLCSSAPLRPASVPTGPRPRT